MLRNLKKTGRILTGMLSSWLKESSRKVLVNPAQKPGHVVFVVLINVQLHQLLQVKDNLNNVFIGSRLDCPSETAVSRPSQSSRRDLVFELNRNLWKTERAWQNCCFSRRRKAGNVERACFPVSELLISCGGLKPKVRSSINWPLLCAEQNALTTVNQAPSSWPEIRTYYMYIYLIPATLPECVSPFRRS